VAPFTSRAVCAGRRGPTLGVGHHGEAGEMSRRSAGFRKSVYQALVEHAAVALLVLDRSGGVAFANRAARWQFGFDCSGRRFPDLFEAGFRDRCIAYVVEVGRRSTAAGSMAFGAVAVRADGSAIRIEVHSTNCLDVAGVCGIVVSIIDVTARHLREQELIAKATIDGLTGLANRAIFLDRLGSAVRNGSVGSVAYADLDLFKRVNDEHGHDVGDLVLQEVARRLVRSLPETADVARFGGDEFVLFLPNVAPSQAPQLLRQTLLDVARPIEVDGRLPILTSMSIGITALGSQAPDATLRDCDMAMYAAKARGRNQAVVFGDEVRKVLDRRRELASAVMNLSTENRALHVQARTDPLTGLLNRRALDELEQEVTANADDVWTQFAAPFVDIDHFSNFNHHYGDAAGDAVLRKVAHTLRKAARDSDLVFRKGGEEFVVVLAGCDLATALLAAERIRAAVMALRIAHAESATADVVTLTIGIGINGSGRSLAQVVVAAGDCAMAAKSGGRRNAVHGP
jgi:diguanylate cyclase (GGDEF)-like protein/PAS domain S-box-containing protein